MTLGWFFSGMIWMYQGSKPLVGFVVVLLLSSLPWLKGNAKALFDGGPYNRWLHLLFITALFIVGSYLTYGASSQELRSLLVACVFLFAIKDMKLSLRHLQTLLFISSISAFILTVYFVYILQVDRMGLPTNPIPLASHYSLLILLALAMTQIQYQDKNRVVLYAAAALCGFALMYTESRGPILACVAVVVLLFGLRLWRQFCLKQFLILIAIASLAGIVAMYLLAERIDYTLGEVDRIARGDLDSSIGLRLQMYVAGWEIFKNHPWLGVGRVLPEHVQGSELTELAYRFVTNGHLHNNFIDKLASSGGTGFTLLALALCLPCYFAYTLPSQYRALIVLVCVLYILLCMLDSPFKNGDTAVLYFVTIGLLLKVISTENENPLLPKTPVS